MSTDNMQIYNINNWGIFDIDGSKCLIGELPNGAPKKSSPIKVIDLNRLSVITYSNNIYCLGPEMDPYANALWEHEKEVLRSGFPIFPDRPCSNIQVIE